MFYKCVLVSLANKHHSYLISFCCSKSHPSLETVFFTVLFPAFFINNMSPFIYSITSKSYDCAKTEDGMQIVLPN